MSEKRDALERLLTTPPKSNAVGVLLKMIVQPIKTKCHCILLVTDILKPCQFHLFE